MAFPASPADGATTLVNGVTYVYSLANVAWSPVASVNSLAVSSLSVSGNSSVTGTETVGTSVVTGNESVGGNETVTGNQIVLGNLGVGTASPTYKVDIFAGALGTTAGNTINLLEIYNSNSNANYLRIFQTRNATGAGWDTSTTRIQNVTDVTNQSYIDFNPVSGNYALAFGTGSGGATEKVRIDSSGNVGIGTTNPSNKLQVLTGGAGTDGILVASSGGQFVHMRANNSSGANNALVSTGDQSITFGGNGIDTGSLCIVPWASSASGIKITASGNVGIGTSSPVNLLTVQSSTAQNDTYGYLQTYYSGNLTTANSGFTAKNYQGTSQFMQWDVYGVRIGSRIKTNTGAGAVYFTYGNDTVGMTLDSSGRVLMPYQTAFLANNPSTGNVTETNGYDFPFNNTVFNIGNCYNTSTNRFTAPVAGVYHFSYNLFNNGGTGRIAFKLNGSSYNNTQNDATATTGFITESKTMYLSANDYVTVGDWQSISGKVIYMGHSSFSGFLVG